jgi:hypothetical protein
MKLGLDFHGVITDNESLFAMMSSLVLAGDGEVHIITGARKEMFEKQCEELNISPEYSHFFSISDYHIENGDDVDLSNPDFPKMDSKIWDTTKAVYCRKHNIDLMIDDSPHYGEYFSTPYMLYKNDLNSEMFKYDVIQNIRKRTT